MLAAITWWLSSALLGLFLEAAAATQAAAAGPRAAHSGEEATASQVQPLERQRLVLKAGTVDPAAVAALQELLKSGSTAACCGRWRDRAAAQLQRHVALELGLSKRRLSDVRMSNSTLWLQAAASSGHWGAVAVLYLDEGPSTTVSVEGENARPMVVNAPRGTVLVVPEGERVMHEAARSVAWLRLRREGTPDRSVFEFFVASAIRSSFVAPHNTAPQRKFFRSHSRNPTYWHGFLWSFLGLFCTMLACQPLFGWCVQRMEQRLSSPPGEDAAAALV